MALAPRLICEAAGLAEGGRGVRFGWSPAGGEGKGFAIRYDGGVVMAGDRRATAGYTIANDVSARDHQRHDGQWTERPLGVRHRWNPHDARSKEHLPGEL